MPVAITADWDRSQIGALEAGPMKAALRRALKKAGATALRDMRSEGSKRVRKMKRIKASYVRRAITMRPAKGSQISDMEWRIDVDGKPVPLSAYPSRQTKKGVTVEVNRGKRTLLKGAFKVRTKSGHTGVFLRRGKARLPIDEQRGSRPVDALLHKGEADAVAARGGKSFGETFVRVLPLELGK
jgi:hypothetical protein